jgi:hypothetical protein
MVLRGISVSKGEVTEQSRNLNNEELQNLYSSLHITRIIKLRRMRWADM